MSDNPIFRSLSESEQRMRLASSAAQLGVFEWDVPNDTAYWENDRMYEIFGRRREDGPLSYEEFLGEVLFEDDRETFQRELKAAIDNDRQFGAVCRIRRQNDGQCRWVEYACRFELDDSGAVRRLVGIVEDITEPRRAEQALARQQEILEGVFENIPVLLVMWDPHLERFTLNAYARSVLGWTEEDMASDDFMELVYPDDAYRAKVIGYMQSLEPGFHEWICAAKSGERIPIDWANIKLADDTMIGIGVDLRERKEAERALRELNESLERRVAERTGEVRRKADQLRALAGQLSRAEQVERKRLARILHDHIQQLIVAARMQLGWMTQADDAGQLQAAAQGVDSILHEALEASRSLAIDLSPPVLHESGLAAGLNWLASRLREKHQFEVKLRTDSDAEPATEETRLLLFECARELLFNVIKHAGVSQASVTLERAADDRLALVVADRGKGFDPNLLEKRRADEVTFGLFSIQERLTQIGGGMDVETTPGKGTRIVLTAPIGETEERIEEPAEEGRARQEAESAQARQHEDRCRVLIVDDHRIMREGLSKLLQLQKGGEVVGEAADGPQAIEMVDSLDPDVVIMDVNLGVMSGVEATRRILSTHPHLRVVGLSMHVDNEIARAMREAGASAYLTKGGPSQDLVDAILACGEGG